MGRTLNRVAGVVSAAALATFAATPAALAEDETPTSSTETSTSTSETSTTSSSATSDVPTTVPSSTSAITTATPDQSEVKTTERRIAPKAEPELKGDTQVSAPEDDPQQDNVGHGFVGLGGEGVLVIACAAGAPGSVATQYLEVTSGPDQDGANGLLWNYTVRVANLPAGTTTGKFSWTCGKQEGEGIVEFEQEQPPVTSTTTATSAPASSTAPVTTATSSPATSTSAAGNAAPRAQVKVTPKGKIETGFGGTAW
ncbi:hypothetical protein ACWEVP_05740 [Amycolatopsis sp. NPDC003865]